MITQKLISLKINYDTLEELDSECMYGGGKRNWHINRAIMTYLKLKDARRLYRCVGTDQNKQQVLQQWLREWFPEAATW